MTKKHVPLNSVTPSPLWLASPQRSDLITVGEGNKTGTSSSKLPPPHPRPPTCPSSQKEIKMQVTPSSAILLRLSVTQSAEPLIMPPSCHTPFSSLPLNYWWPWLHPHTPHPLTTPKHSPSPALTLLHTQLCMCESVWQILRLLAVQLQHENYVVTANKKNKKQNLQ